MVVKTVIYRHAWIEKVNSELYLWVQDKNKNLIQIGSLTHVFLIHFIQNDTNLTIEVYSHSGKTIIQMFKRDVPALRSSLDECLVLTKAKDAYLNKGYFLSNDKIWFPKKHKNPILTDIPDIPKIL